MFKFIKQIFVSIGLLGDLLERGNKEAKRLIDKPDWFSEDIPPKATEESAK